MHEQADQVGDDRPILRTAAPSPADRTGPALIMADASSAAADDLVAGPPGHGGRAAMVVLEGRLAATEPRQDAIHPQSLGRGPHLAALSSGPVASDAPGAAPNVPVLAPEPAVRTLLYLFFDDPRLDERPRLGDQWAADLPDDVAAGIWSNRVTAVHEVIQVDGWCSGSGPDGHRAWLSDRIRLLQVRVEMDPAVQAGFEAALPIFDGAEPGFFHNHRPLLGGRADAPVMERARSFLRDMPGGVFFDDAATLAAAMREAGCTEAVWNGGDGPANDLGASLTVRFGS